MGGKEKKEKAKQHTSFRGMMWARVLPASSENLFCDN